MKKYLTCFFAIIPFFLLTMLFELLPIFMTVIKSFQPQDIGGFGIDNYVTVLTKKYYLNSISNSVIISIFSSSIGIFVAFLGAMAAHNASNKIKNIVETLLNITSNFAGIPLAIAYIVLMGSTGIMVTIGKQYGLEGLANFDLYSVSGLGMIYVYFQIPVSTLLLLPAFEGIRKEWLESAELLKASRFKFWLMVGIPVIMPSILGTFCFLFANSMSAYASAYALMGSNFSLMTTLISSMISGDAFPKYGIASALSVIMIILIGMSVFLNSWLLNRRRKEQPR